MNVSHYPDPELDLLLERAAQRGAEIALASIGLNDESAKQDVEGLRALLSAWNGTKSDIWKYVVRWATMITLTAIAALLAAKLGWRPNDYLA